MLFQRLKKCFLTLSMLFLLVSSIAAFGETQLTPSAENTYIIVIDAGSSGSRIHVFNYQLSQSSEIKKLNEVSYSCLHNLGHKTLS